MRLVHVIPLVLLLGACAVPEPAPAPASEADNPSQPVERIKSQPLKHLVGRTLKPIPDKELEIRTKCSFRDVAGGRGSMDLQVSKAEVKRFVAEVSIPRRRRGTAFPCWFRQDTALSRPGGQLRRRSRLQRRSRRGSGFH